MKNVEGGLPPLQGAVSFKPGKEEADDYDDGFPSPAGVVIPMGSLGSLNGGGIAGSHSALPPMNGHSQEDPVVL